MKFTDKLIKILLAITVIISIFLSIKTWLDIGSYTENSDSNLEYNDESKKLRSKKLIYLPNSLYLHNDKGIKLTHQEAYLDQVLINLSNYNYSITEPAHQKSKEELLQYQNALQSIELEYFSHFNLYEFLKVYNIKVIGDVPHNFEFNRLFINIANGDIYVLNTDSNKMMTLSANHHFQKIYQKLLSYSNEMMDVTKAKDNTFNYILTNDIKLPKYKYAIVRPSYTVFTKSFFETTGELTSKDENENLVFKDNKDNILKLDNDDGIIEYTSNLDNNVLSPQEVAVKDIQKLGDELGDIRFFFGDNRKQLYKVYIEGYPMFSDRYEGEVKVDLEKKYLKLLLNQKLPQIPLPITEDTTVMSTQKVDELLRNKNINIDQVKYRQIGYIWHEEDKNTVVLEPTWFLYYDHQWHSLDTLLS